MEVRRISVQHARHEDRTGRCRQRGDRHPGFKSPHQLLQDEHCAGGRRVEGGREARPRAGRDQRPGIRPFALCQRSRHVGDDRTHLYARAFAAKRQPGPDREQPAEEFHRQYTQGRGGHILAQYRLDVRNSAARRFRRKASHQPGRQRHGARAAGGHEHEAHDGCDVGPADQRVAPRVRVLQAKAEQRADRTCASTHDACQQDEQQQAAMLFPGIGSASLLGIHRLLNPTSIPLGRLR